MGFVEVNETMLVATFLYSMCSSKFQYQLTNNGTTTVFNNFIIVSRTNFIL